MTTMPLAEVRAHLSQLVDSAISTHERIEITRNGRRSAVLLSSDDFDSLIETLDILSDANLVRELTIALDEAAEGQVESLDEVRADMEARGRLPR
jgi:antitoxin YefM